VRPSRSAADREERAALALDQPGTLDRELVARPRQRHVAVGGGKVLALEAAGQPHAVAAIGRRHGVAVARDEDRDLGGEAPRRAADLERVGVEDRAAAGRRRAPEVGELALDADRYGAGPGAGKRAASLLGRLRDPDAAREESRAEPECGEGEAERGAAPVRRGKDGKARAGGRDEDGSRGGPARRPRAAEDPDDESDRGPGCRRLAIGEDRPDHAARSSETRASTRCVKAKKS
jgi:hypothetical protein